MDEMENVDTRRPRIFWDGAIGAMGAMGAICVMIKAIK